MKYSFKDKVAIITGSSRGIGKAVALALVKNGAKVVLNGRDELKLEKASKEFGENGYEHIALAGDISDPEFCQQLVDETIDKYGRLDILINNAGLSTQGLIEESNPKVFQQAFNVNVLGVIYPTKAAIPHLRKTKGSIIITGSIAGFMGLPEFSAYSATKAALTALAQSIRIEVAKDKIHVGLNYVGFAENDAQKTFINKKGNIENMPTRSNFKRMPLEKVAEIFLNGIAKRKRKQVLSGLGYGTYLLSRFIPGLFEKIMIKKYLGQSSKG